MSCIALLSSLSHRSFVQQGFSLIVAILWRTHEPWTLEPGFENAYGHLNLGSSLAVGHIGPLLGPRPRGQRGLARTPSVAKHVAIKLSCSYTVDTC